MNIQMTRLPTFPSILDTIKEEEEHQLHRDMQGLFQPQHLKAVQVAERCHVGRVISANTKATAGVRALLRKCAKPILEAYELTPNTVIAIHRRPEEYSSQRHGMFATIEDIMGEELFLTLNEVASRPRDHTFKKIIPLDSKEYPNMGIYRGTKIHQVIELLGAIERGEVFELDVNPRDFHIIVDNVIVKTQPNRRVPFYGDTYNCNNFLFDVLKEIESLPFESEVSSEVELGQPQMSFERE